MGFGTYFFGHSPDWLIEAIEEQLRTGMEIGPQSPLAGEVAQPGLRVHRAWTARPSATPARRR